MVALRTIARRALATLALVAFPSLAGAQGYDARWNPNYRPPAPALGGASADQLWRSATPYLDRNDYRDAFPYVARCAQMGNVHCEAEMGILYQSNDIGPENDRLAARWFSRAAAQGHRAAEYELASMYDEGEGGLPRDPARAIALYKASAAQDYGPAFLVLAIDYELGEGVTRSRTTAIADAAHAGGYLGNVMARVLANPGTPRFSSEAQMGRYLARVAGGDFARTWAAAMSPYDKPTQGITPEGLHNENVARWNLNHPGEPYPH